LNSHDALSIYSTIQKVNKTIIIIQSRVKQFRIGPIRDSAQPMSEHTRFSPLDRLRTAEICQMPNKPALDLFFSRNPRVLTPSRSPLLWQRRQVRDEPPAPHPPSLHSTVAARRARRGTAQARAPLGRAAAWTSRALAWPHSPPLGDCQLGRPAPGRTQQQPAPSVLPAARGESLELSPSPLLLPSSARASRLPDLLSPRASPRVLSRC